MHVQPRTRQSRRRLDARTQSCMQRTLDARMYSMLFDVKQTFGRAGAQPLLEPADRPHFCALAVHLQDKGDICMHGAEASASYLDDFSGKVCNSCNEKSAAGGEVGVAAAPATIGAVVVQGRHDHAKAKHRIGTSFLEAEACERVEE